MEAAWDRAVAGVKTPQGPQGHPPRRQGHHPGLEREGPAERYRKLLPEQGGIQLFPREREAISLLLRFHLKDVKLKLHEKYDYYEMLRRLPEPCLSHPCWGSRSHRLTLQ